MADNYVQFSDGLKVDELDLAWIKAKIEYFENPPDDDSGAAWDEFIAECEAYEVDGAEEAGRGFKSSGLEFEVDFTHSEVIFYSEEYGNWYHAARLVQELFRERHPDACWSISWAETCSKARPGEFGGGAAFVTAEDIEVFSTYNFVTKKTDDWNRLR